MKIPQIIGITSGLGVVGIGLLSCLSNPSISRYENHAGKQIAAYLKDNVCQNSEKNLPNSLGQLNKSVENYCKTIVDASQPRIGELVGNQTSHQNYFFFSIYQTDIDLPDPFPQYSFESIGVFNHFYTFRAEKT